MHLSLSETSVQGTSAQTDRMSSQMTQTPTGHGEFAEYLHSFKLKDSQCCTCDRAKNQDVMHGFEDCVIFARDRVVVEIGMGTRISRRNFLETS
ncbi:hypothetical protein EVAR_75334_1 [Eumeta japonica]|uniref:Uncharacterized protein n=1 Tax=Eumeta variegata TaxID=151549 RepID=A0A4C1XZR2_EUMVA|nr:hypothetical protein EVAR_75334_1 [Eumeta japonica]